MENLLPFLDHKATSVLAQAHVKTRNILQGSYVWNKLIRRCCPYDEHEKDFPKGFPSLLQEKIKVIKHLVAILKLMRDPRPLLLDLLDLICERFPPHDIHFQPERMSIVRLACPRHPEGHVTPFSGFLLLEEVESAFGSALLNIETIMAETLKEPCLSALSQRASRQMYKITSFSVSSVIIQTKKSAEAFNAVLLQVCKGISERLNLDICGEIGREGWKALAEALQLRPNMYVWYIRTFKCVLDAGRREDTRDCWEAIGPSATWFVSDEDEEGYECLDREDGEEGWRRLVEIMDMTEDDWIDQVVGNVDEDGYYIGEDMFDEEEEDEDAEERDEEEEEESEMEEHNIEEAQFGPVHFKLCTSQS